MPVELRVTEIRLTPIRRNGGLVAMARVVLNDSLALDCIGVHEKLGGGYRLTYPNKNDRPVFHPINREAGLAIEHAILTEACKQLKAVNNDRHCGADPAR